MKRLLLGLLLVGGFAHAQLDDAAGRGGLHNVNLKAGFTAGGFALGAGYEYLFDQATGIGGEFRTYQKNDDRGSDGVMVVGATLGHHFYKKSWDLSFTPSFNLISIDRASAASEDVSSMGPGLSIGLTWQMNQRVAVGFDNSRYWIWFDEDARGLVMDDMSVKVKASF